MSSANSSVIDYCVSPARLLQGEFQVPGDKSISHRTIMFAALAEGTSYAEGFLKGADLLSTIAAFRALGVSITEANDGIISVEGVGLHGLTAANQYLDCGNAGTAMRLMSGLLVGQNFSSILMGDESLMGRPMRRVVGPLTDMGANITTEPNGCAPIRINPKNHLHGISHTMKHASAQVKSALLIAGLYAEGDTSIIEVETTRNHTERMLSQMGANINVDGKKVTIAPLANKTLRPLNIRIPGDFSSAAFWLVAASIAPDPSSEVLLTNVGMNPSRNGAINILQLMGANIEIINQREAGGEPVADIRVRPAILKGIRIPKELVSLSIDEFPVLFIAAATADGVTTLTNAKELRVKESDRLKTMSDGMAQLGINHELFDDGISIEGQEFWQGTKSIENGGGIITNGDHRIAMSFAVASLRATDDIHILDCTNVATSYPTFTQHAETLGINITSF